MASATVPGFRLGIDFGTSHTTAILRWPDGHARTLLFDGSPLLPSAVYLDTDGRLLVGRDATHAARLDPARFEASPKRRVNQDSITLGEQQVAVTAMVAAVLRRVKEEAERVRGARIDDVTLTHPAGWNATRTTRLVQACRLASLPDPAMVPEPVAAAGYFVSVLGRTIPAGSALVVYDFGGGTFDASAVTPAQDGYRVLALAGLDNVGGVDLDAALLQFVATVHRGQDPEAWQRLENPQTPADRRHRRHLIEDVRAAKEMLSRADTATVPVPLLELEARVTRAEFDALARPLLDSTVATTAEVIRAANLPPERIAAILLVGGSSRIPLIADLLRQGTGMVASTIDQPETVVAEGSVRLASGASGTTRAASAVPAPTVPGPPPGPHSQPVDPWASGEHTPVLTPVLTPVPATALATVPAGPPHWRQASSGPTLLEPAAPTAAAPTAAARPVPPRTAASEPNPYQGVVVRPRRRRRWIGALAGILVVAGVVAGLAIARPDLYANALPRLGPGQNGASGSTQYVRPVTPTWLPAGWTKVIDDEQQQSVVDGPASHGGKCTYVTSGVLQVNRDAFDVSGCVSTQAVKDLVVRDGAVEAELKVRVGCAGMWMRTGTRGYFLAVCRDGTIDLHRLANDPASDQTRLARFSPPFDPNDVVVGLLLQGSTFTIYVNGQPKGMRTDTSPDQIPSGRVGVGGFAPDNALDVTIIQFRTWTPPRTTTTQ